MIAVALETSTDRLSVAGRREGGPAACRLLEGARRHAAGLFPLLQQVLDELGATPGEVSDLALADGPGSFTGLRVGAAALKALARARPGLRVWTASTLLVRAAGVAAPRGARVLVATSALRGELYAATYRFGEDGSVDTLAAPGVATPESLHQVLPDLVVADAPGKLVDRLADQFAVPTIRPPASLPQASALLALIGVRGGAAPISALDEWQPSYGRPAEAQVKWEAAYGRPLPDPARHDR